MINGGYLTNLCRQDWRIYKAFSIANALSVLGDYVLDEYDNELVRKRIESLHTRIEKARKSIGWMARARIGDKKRWYELSEQDKEIIDSQENASYELMYTKAVRGRP